MVVLKFMRFVLIILAFLATFFPIYINISAFALTNGVAMLETLWGFLGVSYTVLKTPYQSVPESRFKVPPDLLFL
ncbi:MAG: hypothetical protein P9L93_03190 [Candidatus Gorgyraea atricola]|nr:hypothetical protein [Candidatus Gorgyraea atricola]